MNKKGKQNKLIGIVLLVAAVIAIYFLVIQPSGGLLPQSEGDIVNGYWNEATQQCWSSKSNPSGTPYIPGQIGATLYQCCMNQAGQQVNCNKPSEVLGTFAIYQGQAGIFSVAHGITITNTGNVALTKAWIDSATWTPTNTALTTAYSGMVGSANGVALGTGLANDWSTSAIDLQVIGGTGIPITYNLSLVTKGSATNLADVSKTTTASISVEKEVIGFSVVINLGA